MRQYSEDNMDVVTLPASRDHPEVVLIVHDETVLHQNDGEDWSYQEVRRIAHFNPAAMCI